MGNGGKARRSAPPASREGGKAIMANSTTVRNRVLIEGETPAFLRLRRLPTGWVEWNLTQEREENAPSRVFVNGPVYAADAKFLIVDFAQLVSSLLAGFFNGKQ